MVRSRSVQNVFERDRDKWEWSVNTSAHVSVEMHAIYILSYSDWTVTGMGPDL